MSSSVTTALGANGRKVVIDACAAIKLQRLERLGSELFTTSGVLREVKDDQARAMLSTLPVELKTRECLPQDLAYVKQFAKATGDFGFLSQNDMELMALTVALHRESGGAPLREKPAMLSHGDGGSAAFDWAPARADKNTGSSTAGDSSAPAAAFQPLARNPADEVSGEADNAAAEDAAEPAATPTAAKDSAEHADHSPASNEASTSAEGGEAKDDNAGSDLEPDEPLDSDEDGSSAGEWVTPQNMHRFGVAVQPDVEVKVTCATADYSVQNVLLQMGITPLTFDGYAVRSVKTWGLICRACFNFTKDSSKVFCPKCGHDTLVRVPIVVGQDGKPTALNQGRPLRRKGTVYSCPKPTTGRGWKPIFAEDELKMGGRDRELRRLQNLADKEKASRDPFNEDNGARGWWQRGCTSTGKMLTGETPRVQAGYGRRNPNANNFRGFNKKKR